LSNQNVQEERLTVAIGDVHEIKLLGVPDFKLINQALTHTPETE